MSEPPPDDTSFQVQSFRREDPLPLRVLAWVRQDLDQWCRDRSWEVRVPVLLFFLYLLLRYLFGNAEYNNFLFGGINLAFHEAGHALFQPFGEFLMVAGGTILQCLIPLIAAIAFWRTQRDYFGVAFCFAWLGTNFFNCAVYAGDARGQRNLALVSPWGQSFGADGNGDWTRMLTKLGMLKWDTTIEFWFRVSGTLCFVAALAAGAYVLWRMYVMRQAPPPPPPEWAEGGPARPLRRRALLTPEDTQPDAPTPADGDRPPPATGGPLPDRRPPPEGKGPAGRLLGGR